MKYHLVYDPSDNEPLWVSANLELVERECEDSGTDWYEIDYHE